MSRNILIIAGILAVAIGFYGIKDKSIEAKSTVSFKGDIFPVFVKKCGVCHKRVKGNKAAVKNGVYFETKQDILGKVGKFIIPGKPEKSGLLKVLNQTYPVGEHKIVMPPPKSKVSKWSEKELELFSRWIKQGAGDN